MSLNFLNLFWYLIIAGSANMTPPLVVKLLSDWDSPLDFGLKFKNIRIFGDHKTIRGLVIGTLVSQLIYLLFSPDLDASPFFGAYLGGGVLLADAVKSFFKRRFRIPPGNSWFPWDQIDWIIGIIVVCFQKLNLLEIFFLLTVGVILHLLVKALGYIFKLNKDLI